MWQSADGRTAPIEIVTSTAPFSPIGIGVAATAERRRSTSASSSRSSPISSSSTQNSSPPQRDVTSHGRVASLRRRAISRSTTSPIWWPCVSLMRLKWSTSTSAIAAPAADPARRARSTSEKCRRLNSSVSASTLESHSSRRTASARSSSALPLVGDVADRAGEQARGPSSTVMAARSRTQRGDAVDSDQAVVLLHDLAVALDQVGEAPGDIELGAIVRMHEIVVAVNQLLRLLGGAEQRGEAAPVGMHDELLVGLRSPL